jgi:hypothetical protein
VPRRSSIATCTAGSRKAHGTSKVAPTSNSDVPRRDGLYRAPFAGFRSALRLLPFGVQGDLFDQPDDVRSISRMRSVDQLNARFGRGTIGFGTVGERQVWGLRREFISPRYTKDWNELLRV